MTHQGTARRPVVGLLLVALAAPAATAQVVNRGAGPAPPLPEGQRIEARDGDLIVVHDDARVRVVRRRDAVIRTVFDAAQRWVVVLADVVPAGATPDGRVDAMYTFNEVSGDWPLGQRWEGLSTIEDYSMVGEGGPFGIGILTVSGLVQLVAPPAGGTWHDPHALAVLSFRGHGRGGGGGVSFDQAEQQQVANAIRNSQLRGGMPGTFTTAMSLTATPPHGVPGVAASGGGASADRPVRVGGPVAPPKKIVDVPPVVPERARAAGIRGLVVLELTIGTDGLVKDARILRSIPLLDQAALDAARQWRYEPVQIDGQAVPLIITAAVPF